MKIIRTLDLDISPIKRTLNRYLINPIFGAEVEKSKENPLKNKKVLMELTFRKKK